MNKRTLVGFTACWIIGTTVAHLYEGIQMIAVSIGLTLLLTAFGILGRLQRKLLLLFGLALWISVSYATFRDAGNVSVLPDRLGAPIDEKYTGIALKGVVADPVKVDGDLAMFEMKVEQVSTSLDSFIALPKVEKVVVRVKLAAKAEQDLASSKGRGDHVVITADLERPATARNFGSFDYRHYLREKQIHWVARVKGISNVVTIQKNEGSLQILRRNDDLRARLADVLKQLYPGVGAGYMQGLLLGLQDELDPETFTEFARLGMTHVLAISGMHVGLYVGALLLVLRRIGLTKETSLVAALCFVPPYVLLTGSSPSAVRAGIMSMIALYAARRGWLKDGLHILCLAALLMLMVNPYYLTSISFQLSFAVTAGIILLSRPMQRILSFLPTALSAAVAISVVADLVSFPLSLYYFNQYPLLGLAANLILVPFITFVSIPLGTVSLIIGTFWIQGAEWIAYPVRLVNAFVFWCADHTSSIIWARTLWATPSVFWIAMYLILLCIAIFALDKGMKIRSLAQRSPLTSTPVNQTAVRYGGIPDTFRHRFRPWGIAVSISLIGVLLVAAYHPRTSGVGWVQMLDVGQGDAILITTPEGKHVLVDGGGTVSFERPGEEWKRRIDPYEVGQDVVVPILKKRGVHRLDALVLTHGDRDHYGGLLAVIDEIPVKRFIMNGTRSGNLDLDELFAATLRSGAEVYAPQDGDRWQLDDHTELEFFNPSDVFTGHLPEFEDQNEYSVAFRLMMNDHSFLFTGDIGASAEQDILERLQARDDIQPIEVLKVGHHGSKHSTTEAWVRRWLPQLSIISVGAKNTYGHPNSDVIDRLEQSGSEIRRTDQNGEIQIQALPGEPLHVRSKF
ncbi:DNA internalization-related competence protein ComEC/Rec2 [Saccharibacillus sp. JS10]|uniref:DNA internalization-related competence protein ComEC/Rec2 n=1 Tax=Saccharibacillus sp. JS10 TaxID=2950552 RepID=UPI00210C5E1D|nr:DNA internalization-related competence protein ComEC/Rec2 [Saccharibacillus sp. JS10]MCQ4086177.1 DNA internalization-related competence protein ComEC/Rec2 [Saccharibacillus sp. JS10]